MAERAASSHGVLRLALGADKEHGPAREQTSLRTLSLAASRRLLQIDM